MVQKGKGKVGDRGRVFKVSSRRKRCKRGKIKECKCKLHSECASKSDMKLTKAGFIFNLFHLFLFELLDNQQKKQQKKKQTSTSMNPNEGQRNRKGTHNSNISFLSCVMNPGPHSQLHRSVRKDLLQPGALALPDSPRHKI